jgi:YesN/AraC family two-component response regulator
MFYNICKFEKDNSVKNYNNKISTAIKYIEKNYSNNLSLEEVAKYINMNTSYFSNTFKKETGVYFSDFLQKIRVEKSKGLLVQPQHKIYEIAEKVGFMDEKYYFKIFKKLTGITPNQYRNGVPLDSLQNSERES